MADVDSSEYITSSKPWSRMHDRNAAKLPGIHRRQTQPRRGLVARMKRPPFERQALRRLNCGLLLCIAKYLLNQSVHSVSRSTGKWDPRGGFAAEGGVMRVIRADVSGMCFGVRDALAVIGRDRRAAQGSLSTGSSSTMR